MELAILAVFMFGILLTRLGSTKNDVVIAGYFESFLGRKSLFTGVNALSCP